MIKPEFWSSETLMRVSRDSRLTFIGIWNFCDDYGFCLNSNRSLIGDIYPYDETVTEVKLKTWIAELVAVKLLIPVDYKSKKLLFVKGWGEHQTVQHKSKRSFIDNVDLEQVIKDSLKSHEDLIAVYLDSHAPKRKKKEESNKEKEESNKEKGFIPPTLLEVKAFFLEKGYLESSGEKAFNYYDLADWVDGKGNKVKNWKQKMNGVWFKDENLIQKKKDTWGNRHDK